MKYPSRGSEGGRAAFGLAGTARLARLAMASAVAGTGAMALIACSSDPTDFAGPDAGPAHFSAWVESLWPQARAKGVSRATFDNALREVTPDPAVLEAAARQPEFVKPVWEYLDRAVSETRVANGREKLAAHGAVLASVEAAYQVDRYAVLAIWGMESGYGANLGDKSVVRSLATLGYQGERASFGRTQLIAALQILERGDTTAQRMLGSWAGAMGHTQFIPTTYNAYAVDHDQDGRRDIWETIPDALGSSAHYLKRSGWDMALPWGFEVAVPRGFDFSLVDKRQMAVSGWAALGVRRADGGGLGFAGEVATLIAPAGARGPKFLVFRNFRAILRYNNAVSYALAVGILSDRLRGQRGVIAPWPLDDRPLSQDERRELQQRLTAAGFHTDGVDGRLGPKSLDAVRAYQMARGLTPDGYASLALLQHLRGG